MVRDKVVIEGLVVVVKPLLVACVVIDDTGTVVV